MKIVFIGSVLFSKLALEELLKNKAEIIGVVAKEKSDFNADFADLGEVCKKFGVNYIYSDDANSVDTISYVKSLNPDYIFCCGWSNLLKKQFLEIAPVIGFHPAELPFNRGRHPIIWALVLGLKKTASTFFFMDEGADSGDIISQKKIAISDSDDANSLYNKVVKTALAQLCEIYRKLKNNSLKAKKQNHKIANIWRKRSKIDGQIDFRMSSEAIYNLVRALAKPYPGAHLIYHGQDIKIWKVQIKKFKNKNIEPGKIIDVYDNKILVRTYGGALEILEHEFVNLPKKGEYL